MPIELLTSPGCPNAEAARKVVTDCLTTLGIDVPIIPGIMPITRVGQIERMAKLSGSTIPEGLRAELHSLAAVADPPEVREGEVVPGIQHDRHAGSGPLRAARTRCSGSLTGGAGWRHAASSARPASPVSSSMAPSRHSAAVASRR